MLDALRTATKGFVGRALMTIVLGLIIVSFAIWGIGDIFRGFGAGDLAKVGRTEISIDAYRNAYQAELQRLQRATRRAVTNDDARMLGIDQQVLQRLLGNAALDQETRALGLGLDDEELARQIAREPMFRGVGGQFDRRRFESILRDNGLTERTYITEQRSQALRGEVVDALTHGLDVPLAMLAAIHQFQTESRAIDYVVLPTALAGAVPEPTEAELQKFFDERQELYRVPESRSFVTVSVTPESLAKPESVADADAQKRYEEVEEERFRTPERRAVEQILFPDEASARAAGKTFDQLLAERNLTPKDASLGTLARNGFADKTVAEAAFALPLGGVSAPIVTPFGTVLVRITEIVPSTTKPYAEVAAELKREIAVQRARAEVGRIRDTIEDRRADGKTLAEATQELGLELREVAAIDPLGNDMEGKPVAGIATDASLRKAVFASDVGVDNETLRTRDGGYQWFEVVRVTPARQKGFDEVKPEVEKAWRDDEIAERLSAKAADLVKRLEGGETMAAVAASEGNLEVRHAKNLARSGGGDGPAAKAAAHAFNVAVEGAGSVALDDGSRLLFRVTGAEVPAFDAASPSLRTVAGQVKQAITEDVLGQYLGKLQADLGVNVNARAFAAAIGSASGGF
jgi:peptidyl-prolyl cis-trans isomerase D